MGVWSDLQKSFLLLGGELLDVNNNPTVSQNIDAFLEYFPGNKTWASLVRLTAFWLFCFHGSLRYSGWSELEVNFNRCFLYVLR